MKKTKKKKEKKRKCIWKCRRGQKIWENIEKRKWYYGLWCRNLLAIGNAVITISERKKRNERSSNETWDDIYTCIVLFSAFPDSVSFWNSLLFY